MPTRFIRTLLPVFITLLGALPSVAVESLDCEDMLRFPLTVKMLIEDELITPAQISEVRADIVRAHHFAAKILEVPSSVVVGTRLYGTEAEHLGDRRIRTPYLYGRWHNGNFYPVSRAPTTFCRSGRSAPKALQLTSMIQIGIAPMITAAMPDGTHCSATQTIPFAVVISSPLITATLISVGFSSDSFRKYEMILRIRPATKNRTAVNVQGGILSIAKRIAR